MSSARNTPPETGKRLPGKAHHWLLAAVLFGLLILWMMPATAAITRLESGAML